MTDTSHQDTLPHVSTMTTGNRAHTVALVGPDHQGTVPTEGIDAVVATRGRFVAFGGRTAVLDPDDLAPLHAIQDGMVLRPLSEFLGSEPPPTPAELDQVLDGTWQPPEIRRAG